MSNLTRSGLYPKTVRTYLEELCQEVRAEVILDTVIEPTHRTKLVTSMAIKGVALVTHQPLISDILDRFAKRNKGGFVYMDQGVVVTSAVLDQKNPARPELLLNFSVDPMFVHLWSVVEFQEVN